MPSGGRVVSAGEHRAWPPCCLLTSCDNAPTAAQKKAVRDILTTTTTTTPPTTSTSSSTTTTQPGVVVPNVIGLKIAAARAALRAAGFPSVSLNMPCNKGTRGQSERRGVAGHPRQGLRTCASVPCP